MINKLDLSTMILPYTYEKNQELLPLGKIMAVKFEETFGLHLVLGYGSIDDERKTIQLNLFQKGLHTENNFAGVLTIDSYVSENTEKVCSTVWKAKKILIESLKESGSNIIVPDSHCHFFLKIHDYEGVMRFAFLESDYFVQIDRMVREKYARYQFCLRRQEENRYYLIFEDDHVVKNTALIRKITNDINDLIHEADFLKVFEKYGPVAIPTSKKQLAGKMMGIIGNNLSFYSGIPF